MKKSDVQENNKIPADKNIKQNQKYALMLVWFCIGIMGLCMFSSCNNGYKFKCGQVPEHKSGNISMDSAEVKADYYSLPSCGGCGTSKKNNVYMGVTFSNSGKGGLYFGDSSQSLLLGSCQCAYGIFDDGCICGSDSDGKFATFIPEAEEAIDYIDEIDKMQDGNES